MSAGVISQHLPNIYSSSGTAFGPWLTFSCQSLTTAWRGQGYPRSHFNMRTLGLREPITTPKSHSLQRRSQQENLGLLTFKMCVFLGGSFVPVSSSSDPTAACRRSLAGRINWGQEARWLLLPWWPIASAWRMLYSCPTHRTPEWHQGQEGMG